MGAVLGGSGVLGPAQRAPDTTPFGFQPGVLPPYRRRVGDDLPIEAEDIVVEVPELDSNMTVPIGTTTFTKPTAMRVHTLSVDVASSVIMRVFRDGGLWFSTPGNEAGDRVFRDPRSWPIFRGEAKFEFVNNSGGAARVRAAIIGPPLS